MGTTAARYAAVPVQQMDYYPYGMKMTGGIEIGSIPATVVGSGTITEEAVVYTNYIGTFTNGDGDLQLSGTGTDNSATGVQNVLPGEYIEFTAPPDPIATNRTFVALSYIDGGPSHSTLKYAWYLYPDGRSFVYESGAQMYSNTTPYVPGTTKWRIERTGGNIVYSKNGTVVRTVADAQPTQPMIIDIAMWDTPATDPSRVYNLVVGKLEFVIATYAIGDYVPYVHSDYRFGYNGMEQDPETKGEGNHYTTEFRQYDPRLGRWMSLDPLMAMFPNMSPYVAFDNNPVVYVDPYGLASGPGDPPVGIPAQRTNENGELVDWKVGDVTADENRNLFRYDGEGKWSGIEMNLDEVLVLYDSPDIERAATHEAYIAAIWWAGYGDAIANAETLGFKDAFGGRNADDFEMFEEKESYLNGRIAGDLTAAGVGVAQSEIGYGAAAGGLVTGPGAVVISTSGLVVAIHGHGVTATATIDLIRTQVALANLMSMNGGTGTESGGDGSGGISRVYEPNPKHGSVNKGKANKAPTNPQSSLDNSFELPGNTSRRVGADKSAGEFNVFDEHAPGKFHGHSRTWNELSQDMKNVLLKNGVVNRKGKILK